MGDRSKLLVSTNALCSLGILLISRLLNIFYSFSEPRRRFYDTVFIIHRNAVVIMGLNAVPTPKGIKPRSSCLMFFFLSTLSVFLFLTKSGGPGMTSFTC